MTAQQTRLVYSKRNNNILFFGILLILFFSIFVFKYWYRLGFNLLFIGYFVFRDMRFAIAFYATMVRIILYPSALINKYFTKSMDKTAEKYKKLQNIKEIFERKRKTEKLLNSKKKVLLYGWFHLCFLTMNAITIGYIFFQKFNREKLSEVLYTDFFLPNFPVKTTGYLPAVGNVDFSVTNLTLNLYSAIGAGIVGLMEVILNKKTDKRQLVKYLVFFPLGAYFLTYWVPCGFEFALIIFEALTVALIFGEKISKTEIFKIVKGTNDLKSKPEENKVKKDEVKGLIKEIITEADQDKDKTTKEK